MPVRIRLQRYGKKRAPFYHIVVADGRAPRDGKYIEKIGTYNPMINPAQIELDVDKAVKWMRNGAQPSDTVRSLLSVKGAMMKHHLLKGVDKGALTVEQAEAKFQSWLTEKEAKIQKSIQEVDSKAHSSLKVRLEAETKLKEAKAAVVAQKKAAALAAAEKSTVVKEVAAPVEATVEAPVEVAAPAPAEAAATEAPAQA
ncbi:MAG: 30S ribosomal protein S16 [Bacteroidales bacterium]